MSRFRGKVTNFFGIMAVTAFFRNFARLCRLTVGRRLLPMLELLSYPFFRNALAGIVLVSLTCALAGTYVVTRRRVFLTGGITHACFGGLGLGYFCGVSPVLCAAAFAVAGALGVDWLHRRQVRSDSAVAVVWAAGMALGTLFVSLSDGYVPDLNAFLFGNVLTVTPSDLWLYLAFAVVLGLFYLLAYPYIVAVSFDADFARTRRVPVTAVDTVMTVLTALSIVLTIKMIGIMLLISLMTLPQITAELFTSRYRRMLVYSAALSVACSVGGLLVSYFISVPASAAIVLLMILAYAVARVIRAASR